jgi:peroxiredoxin
MEMARVKSGYHISEKMALLLTTLGVVLVAVNMLLVQQNKTLKSQFGGGDRSLELKIGKELPPMEGLGIDGEKAKFDYGRDARKTLLLVFSPGCYACEQNMDNWRGMISGLDEDSYRVIAVSLKPDGVKEYISKQDLPDIPVIAEVDPKVRVAYGLVVTPQTVLIGADGKAEKAWTGLLHEEEMEEIGQILNGRAATSNN